MLRRSAESVAELSPTNSLSPLGASTCNMAAVRLACLFLLVQLLAAGQARRPASKGVAGAAAGALPWGRCRRGDPQLDQCVVDALNAARPTLRRGVPSLGLPPLDALRAREVAVEEGPEGLHVSFRLHDAAVSGLDDFAFTRATIHLQPPYVELAMTTRSTRFRGRYSFGGHLLSLSISGEGDGDVEFGGLNVTHRIYLKEEKRDGKVFWKVTEYLYDMDPEYIKVDFKNLFNGDEQLGSYANNFINANWRPLYHFYRRGTVSAFGTPMKDYANILLSQIPVSELFLP